VDLSAKHGSSLPMFEEGTMNDIKNTSGGTVLCSHVDYDRICDVLTREAMV